MQMESAVKAFGWHDAVGKSFETDARKNRYTVKGVVKNDIANADSISLRNVIN